MENRNKRVEFSLDLMNDGKCKSPKYHARGSWAVDNFEIFADVYSVQESK